MVEFVTALTGIKTAFDLLRAAREGLKKGKPDVDEINRHLSEIHEALVNAREALADAQEENRALKAQVDRRQEMEADKHWEAEGGFYRRKSEIAQDLFIPYCPICWNAADNTIPMAELQTQGVFKCGLHEPLYWTKRPESGFRGVKGPKRFPETF